jgi:hypothetical protein
MDSSEFLNEHQKSFQMSFFKRHVCKVILILSITSFILGLVLKEPVMILNHAIRICLGCIGIG